MYKWLLAPSLLSLGIALVSLHIDIIYGFTSLDESATSIHLILSHLPPPLTHSHTHTHSQPTSPIGSPEDEKEGYIRVMAAVLHPELHYKTVLPITPDTTAQEVIVTIVNRHAISTEDLNPDAFYLAEVRTSILCTGGGLSPLLSPLPSSPLPSSLLSRSPLSSLLYKSFSVCTNCKQYALRM